MTSRFGWDEGTSGDKTQRGVVAVSYLMIFGMFICSIVLAVSVPDSSDSSAAGVGVTAFALFGAASAIGAALGFLFGLPRARYADAEAPTSAALSNPNPDPNTAGSRPPELRSAHYLTNSNLIKVSDWLTTIIIGVGLVNLAKVGPAVGDLSNTLEVPLGGAAYSGVLGVSVIIVAALAALILCYLWTTIRVRELLEDAEVGIERNIPHLVGLTVADARAALGDSTLKLVATSASDDAVVVTQDPGPGSAARVGTAVAITVQAAD